MSASSHTHEDAPAPTSSSAPNLRGFAAMTRERKKEVASLGGKAAHMKGVAYEFSSEAARAAGRKGGKAVAAMPGHMAALGRLGAKARQQALPDEEAE